MWTEPEGNSAIFSFLQLRCIFSVHVNSIYRTCLKGDFLICLESFWHFYLREWGVYHSIVLDKMCIIYLLVTYSWPSNFHISNTNIQMEVQSWGEQKFIRLFQTSNFRACVTIVFGWANVSKLHDLRSYIPEKLEEIM